MSDMFCWVFRMGKVSIHNFLFLAFTVKSDTFPSQQKFTEAGVFIKNYLPELQTG